MLLYCNNFQEKINIVMPRGYFFIGINYFKKLIKILVGITFENK